MKTSQNMNNKRPFLKYMQEKLAITVLVITLALFALVLVLYNIVKDKKEDYTQIVLSQQEYDSRVLPYRRGDIVDRNGTYLATSEKVYNLIIDPKQIMSKEANFLDATTTALSQCFQYDKAELTAMIREKKDKYYIRYERQMSYEQKEAFEGLQKEMNESYSKSDDPAVKSKRVKGVWFEDEYKRFYPYNSLACNVIGFARKDGAEGTGGIEQYYNSTLIGNNGREYGYLNDESNLERVIKAPTNGNTVVSTIDINVQNIVEKYITEWENGIGSNGVAVIVMDPNNGEILAMATNQPFDLNNPRDLTPYYSEEEIAAMDEEAEAEAWNKMWRNFSVSDTYEPGSPQKIFTVAAAMEEGLTTGSETFECGGKMEVGGWPIRCVARSGHGPITTEQGLMKSCNVVMMQLAQRMGRERFVKYQRQFGFGSKTGIDLPGEADTENLIYNADKMDAASLATNAFGQNYNCTVVQMAAAYCSAINGGSYYEPHVVKQIVNQQGSVVKKVEPVLVRETVSESTSSFLRETLHKTVTEGTGSLAAVSGYEVGGKTGTAQKYPRAKEDFLVSFAGFAPIDNPEVFVYVVIDVPHLVGQEQAHSSFASEIFSKIMGDILPYLNVFPVTDIEGADNAGLADQEEGISSGTEGEEPESESETEIIPEETTVNYTDEFVELGDEGYNVDLPGDFPSVPEEVESQPSTEASTTAAPSTAAE